MKTPDPFDNTPGRTQPKHKASNQQIPASRVRNATRTLVMCLLVLALGATTAVAQLVLAPVTPTTLAQTGWSELVAGDAAIEFVAVPSGGFFLPGSVQFTIGNPKDSGAQLQWSNTAFTFELTNLVALQYQTYVSSSGQCARKDPTQRRA